MVVCDSAPLIHLSTLGRLDLLRDLFKEATIPVSVYKEVLIEARRLRKPGVSAIEAAIEDGWIRVVEIKERDDIEKLSRNEGIEIEDSEVICLARELCEELVTSDGWLVKIAKTLGVRVLWTTTLVLMATKNGVITRREANQLLRDLVSSGLYLRADVYGALMDAIENL